MPAYFHEMGAEMVRRFSAPQPVLGVTNCEKLSGAHYRPRWLGHLSRASINAYGPELQSPG
jgi:hypothetical protein